jgi:diguanylate cyclase (GGDEF)-like protein
MKIHAKLITSFGTVLVATLAVFGIISYYTFAESTHENSDRIVTLQSSEIIYQATKTFNKEIKGMEQELALSLQTNACSLNSDDETRQLFANFAHANPPLQTITLYQAHGSNMPQEFQTWLDEIDQDHLVEPFLRRQGDDLYLLWPTQTPKGRAFFVITIDEEQLAVILRSYLRIDGATILLQDKGHPLTPPIPQDPLHPLSAAQLNSVDHTLPSGHVDKQGATYSYRPTDPLFGADLTLVVPSEFYRANLISLKNRIIAAMLIVGWISIWILLIIAFKIASPIKKLSKITKDIIAFNYTTDLEIPPSNDEIGELAENFENMRQKIKDLVTKDPLTHVYNRRFMMHIFELAVLKAMRLGENLCCIMMDIDHFKRVNDTYGHQGGDAVLVAVGKTLREISRNYDTPARYGGEEFMFILPETPLSDAITIAERIRTAVKELVIPFEGTDIRCTMSLGVAELDLYHANTTDQIIQYADKALYQAKDNGRDQVVVYHPPSEPAPGLTH